MFGGAGGGFYTINGGAAIPIAAGATATASSSQGGDDGGNDDPAPTSEPPTSSEPPSSTEPTSSSAPPTGTPRPYMIFPADGADTAGFLTTLGDLVKPEVPQVVDVLDAASNANTTLMWVANLTDTQLREVEGNSAVEGTMVNANLTAPAPAEEVEGETVAPPKTARRRSLKDMVKRAVINVDTDDFDLIQLSTAEGSQPGTTYDYDESAGTGISVYVIESDILMDHQEFTDGGRTTRKITIPDMTGGGLRDRAEFHGTCAASKAVGNTAVCEEENGQPHPIIHRY